jgi:hypothetical protein
MPDPSAHWRVLAQDTRGRRVDLRVEGTEFDEVVVGGWLHVERMGRRSWCVIIGDALIYVTVDPQTGKVVGMNVVEGAPPPPASQ